MDHATSRPPEAVGHTLRQFSEKFTTANLLSPRQWIWGGTHPRQVIAACRWASTLESVTIRVDRNDLRLTTTVLPAFSWRRPYLLRGFARACLRLPDTYDQYRAGPPRQNFRTRSAGATREGFTSRVLSRDEIPPFVLNICLERGWSSLDPEQILRIVGVPLSETIAVGTFSRDGKPIAFNVGVIVGDALALKWCFVTERGNARWQCFDALVQYAFDLGVRWIIDDPQVFMTPGNIRFQYDLGFESRNIRVKLRPKA
jgi:hypothetical protein